MQKQPIYPHRDRRSAIHFTIGILMAVIILLACSCQAPRSGCPNMADLKAHKYDDKYGWVRGTQSGLVVVIDKQTGEFVCTYYEPLNK
jgi:hypothetical protein